MNRKDERSKKETEWLRDEALKRALNTPPKPHTNLGKVGTKPTKAEKPDRAKRKGR